MLHFTRDYLGKLADAFAARAYDQVPFQMATAKNEHTNDPERTRGQILDLQVEPDGLYALAEVTEAGEQVLRDNPMLGVSARIVENYSRSDGKFYPAAVQHVLGTLDPRIPQLGSWSPVDMTNGGEMVIDLSQAHWQYEPGPAFDLATSAVADRMGLSGAEADELDQVLAEVEAEEAAAGLAEFDGSFSASYAAEAAREQYRAEADLEDLISPPRRDEDIMARAIARASAGIYDTSRAASFASPSTDAIELSTELTFATGQGLCGDPDPFGRCSSRYHDLQCVHGTSTDWQASGPHPDTYSMALSNFAGRYDLGPSPAAYGDGDDSYAIPQRTLDFAHRLNQGWHLAAPDAVTADDLFGPSYAGNAYAAMMAEVGQPGLDPQPQLPGDGYPDVSAIRAGLGL